MKKAEKREEPGAAPDPRPRPDGVLRVTTGTLRLPQGLEPEEAKDDAMNRVVLLVVAGALAFISIIAWLIYMGQ